MSNINISSYPSVCRLGHRMIQDILDGTVVVQEKVDGSQFSFSKLNNGEIVYRSKSVEIFPESVPALFKLAVETVNSIGDLLTVGWTYRAEAVTKPKHNSLTYSRIPKGGVILYDVQFDDGEHYANPVQLQTIANYIGLDHLRYIPYGLGIQGLPSGPGNKKIKQKVRSFYFNENHLSRDKTCTFWL